MSSQAVNLSLELFRNSRTRLVDRVRASLALWLGVASCRRSLQSPKFPDSGQSGANSTRVGHAQPVPAIVTEAAQRLDIPLVDRARIGKRGHGASDAGLAQ